MSLREAVIEANQNGLDNTIILDAQTYNLSFTGGSDDNFAATGDLDILPRGGRLTIQGQGANQTFITASNLANLFEIHSGATISFSNLTVINPLLDDNVSVSKNVPLTVNILTNDDALKSQSIWLDSFQTTSVQGGTITRDDNETPADLSDDRLVYNPVAGFIGQDSFTYNITDGIVKEQATVRLTVANDAPQAGNDSFNTSLNTNISFEVLTNDSDYNGDSLNVASFQNVSTFEGTITKVNNQLTYSPKANFSGPDTFTYNVSDGFTTTQATVTVLVNAPPNAIVTTTQDTINYTDGLLSLREAIIQANNANIDSTISLGEGRYTLAIADDLDIELQGKTLTIQGQGKDLTILDGDSLDRLFEVHSGATVILSGVTITKGKAAFGGAIYNSGNLSISDSKIENNQALGINGVNGAAGSNGLPSGGNPRAGGTGGSGSSGGDAIGGAIYNSGIITMTNTAISDNQAIGGRGGNGGSGGSGSWASLSALVST